MIIAEITRPQEIDQAGNRLQQGGFVDLQDEPGHTTGTFGLVLAKPGYPFVVKLFKQEDFAYRRYLKLITSVANPHFPKLRGKPTRVNNVYYAVRLERLDPIQNPETNQLRHSADYYLDALVSKYPNRIESYAATLPPTLSQACNLIYQYCIRNNPDTHADLHKYNAMARADGTLVIIDPVAYGSSTDTTPKHPTFDKFPARKPARHFDESQLPDDRTDQGTQTVLFGKSAKQAAAARDAHGHGKMRSKKQQHDPGPLFAPEPKQGGLFDSLNEVTIQSPTNPMLFAKVQQYDDGVHIWFCKKSEGPRSPGGVLQHGVIDKPFHIVLDHVHKVLAEGQVRLGKSGRDYANALIEYLRTEHGIPPNTIQVVYRGKHPAITFPYMGRQMSHFFPATGSDWRGIKNAIRDLRHNLMNVQQQNLTNVRR